MRYLFVVLSLYGFCLPSWSAEQTVVLISIDGFRHDYIEKHDAKNIRAIANKGVRAEGLIPVYPSKTFPNHLSIVTGQYPSNHGIVDNRFYDKERQQHYSMGDGVDDSSWLTTLPIWNLAEFQGVKAATFFWPESSARINGRTPSYYYNYSTPAPNQQRVNQIVNWLKLPAQTRPRIVTGYFSIVDTMGHRFGPDSKQVKEAVQHIDGLIGQLWQRINNETNVKANLILVSDHGMTSIRADQMIEQKSLPINIDLFEVVNSQTRLMLYAKETTTIAQVTAQRQQLRQFSSAYTIETEKSLAEKHVKDGPRKPDIILAAKAPVTFTQRPAEKRRDGGTHGYYANRDMDGIFIAAGPAINAKTHLGRFENIHIYPFMAELLELNLLSPIDGKADVLAPLLIKTAP
ncbi:ectonucleotide pyrophosphatase/phosphodiesterase [Idiomarina piscisalsi]|uniref:Alkaline phosphatase family protein n=1 Tax=Idiomarina piscisalsi TaxID=1096243 RepID=A0A432YPA1_9GAMM|nr:ectonucleotide pyrophosphatase/phosphodiesterase [Idiomarina piscisalsi]RUO62776.1 alkaline phosphatase family protein [Idiomarina piscisalsi]